MCLQFKIQRMSLFFWIMREFSALIAKIQYFIRIALKNKGTHDYFFEMLTNLFFFGRQMALLVCTALDFACWRLQLKHVVFHFSAICP